MGAFLARRTVRPDEVEVLIWHGDANEMINFLSDVPGIDYVSIYVRTNHDGSRTRHASISGPGVKQANSLGVNVADGDAVIKSDLVLVMTEVELTKNFRFSRELDTS